MATILIAGLINLETTVAVDAFPLSYQPVRFPFHGIQTRTSGVGYNLSAALTRLGHQVRLAAMVGDDDLASLVRATMAADGIDDRYLLKTLPSTPQSVILFEPSGRRQIHVDLKDIQEATYPDDVFREALDGVDLALVCNINFARRFLGHIRTRGIPIATDVHTISSLEDPYNRDFMEAADLLFCSDEHLPVAPELWAARVMNQWGTHVLVVGCGAEGSMLAERGKSPIRVSAVSPRPVHNTIGAGDALLSGFIHGMVSGLEPETALRQASYFAGWKIGEASASRGFLTAAELAEKFRSR